MSNWLENAADILAIATALVSWRGFVGLALAIAWAAVDWRNLYRRFQLGTQMKKLQHEQRVLKTKVFSNNYLRLAHTSRDRVRGAINLCVLFLLLLEDDFSLCITP
jgi:hypothetical protein